MKIIKIDETLVEIPDHNYTELVNLHQGTIQSYSSLRELANARDKYFRYLDMLLRVGKYPNIPIFKSTL